MDSEIGGNTTGSKETPDFEKDSIIRFRRNLVDQEKPAVFRALRP